MSEDSWLGFWRQLSYAVGLWSQSVAKLVAFALWFSFFKANQNASRKGQVRTPVGPEEAPICPNTNIVMYLIGPGFKQMLIPHICRAKLVEVRHAVGSDRGRIIFPPQMNRSEFVCEQTKTTSSKGSRGWFGPTLKYNYVLLCSDQPKSNCTKSKKNELESDWTSLNARFEKTSKKSASITAPILERLLIEISCWLIVLERPSRFEEEESTKNNRRICGLPSSRIHLT